MFGIIIEMNRVSRQGNAPIPVDPFLAYARKNLVHSLSNDLGSFQPGQLLKCRVEIEKKVVDRFTFVITDNFMNREPFCHLLEQVPETLLALQEFALSAREFINILLQFLVRRRYLFVEGTKIVVFSDKFLLVCGKQRVGMDEVRCAEVSSSFMLTSSSFFLARFSSARLRSVTSASRSVFRAVTKRRFAVIWLNDRVRSPISSRESASMT